MHYQLRCLLVCLLFISGCSSFQSLEAPIVKETQSSEHNGTNESTVIALNRVYKKYQGVPYLYGGTDRRGFDCSGFIGVVYQEAFGRSLPRTTEQLIVGGRGVRLSQLKTGDLIFFRTSKKQLHAGIYTHNGGFIHASTSKGVIESSLNNIYWKERFIEGRRYL